jgi:molybdopterin converting factor small subunit
MAKRTIQVGVTVHGLLTAAVQDPDGKLELAVPDGMTIEGMIDMLRKRSSLFDPRSSIAVIEGVQVPLARPLQDGDEVGLYPIFGGG